MNDKTLFRKKMLALRKTISLKKKKSQLIMENIITSTFFRNSKVICLYKPLQNEVNIDSLINYALDCGKIVLLPRVIKNELVFLQIDNNTNYERSTFNVLEPVFNEDYVYNGIIDLVIVPGLAFSKDNNRLGYGKGYYDRFLKNKKCLKVGVCFKEQYLDYVPHDDNDIKMDLVIYDKKNTV